MVFRTWTVRDGLIEYLDLMERTARDAWRHAQLCDFASGRVQFKEAPTMPDLLNRT